MTYKGVDWDAKRLLTHSLVTNNTAVNSFKYPTRDYST